MKNEFKSIGDKLSYIQKNEKEPYLFPLLKELYRHKGFDCVEVTHGTNEHGKDLVFKEYDERLRREHWYSVVVKNKNASTSDFENGGEILKQIESSFKYPYINSKGETFYINSVIVVINGTVSQQAKDILNRQLEPHFKNNVDIWNYQRVEEEIDKEIKDLFLDGDGQSNEEIILAKYKSNQIKSLSNLENAKDIYVGLEINDINDIFINIRTSLNKYQEEKNRYKDEKQHIKEEIDDSISILNSNKNTLVRGIATSGKSLLLKRIGINALQATKIVPYAVFYFKFRRQNDFKNIGINKLIEEQFKLLTDGELFDVKYFSKLILLFDGLDELMHDEDKLDAIKAINSFIETSKEVVSCQLQVIISGRNLEIFESELFSGFEKITLLPFDVGQAFKLVKKIIPNDKQKASAFVNAIKSNQLSNSLTRTPMALTLTAILYRDGEVDLTELPANITELYNKFCDYYLARWDASKGISSQYKFEETKHILGFVAFELHSRGIQEISKKELFEFLTSLNKQYSFDELTNVNSFIESLKDRAGLIQFNEQEHVFSFNNLSFQEYFTSIFFDDSNEQLLLNNLYKEWWENTIIFYCGKQPKRDVFICKAVSDIIPLDISQLYQHISLLSKCLQASHLISNSSQFVVIRNLILNFDKLYKRVIEIDSENAEGVGLTYSLSTLDIILQFRTIFEKLFQTKHIHFETFSQIALSILTKETDSYSDVTLYSLSYFLSHKMNDPIFLNEFVKIPNLNLRWSRIVCRDVDYLHLKQKFDPSTYARIKRKQEHNKEYIKKQLKESAILHLKDGTKIGDKF